MRQIILLFIFVSLTSLVNAQSTITDGYINYNVTIDSDEPAAALLSLGTSLEVAFKGNKTKVIAKVAGGSNTVQIIADNSKMNGLSIMDVLGEKKAVKLEKKHIEDAKRDAKKFADNPKKYSDATKTIAGYECKKVLMKDLQSGANIILYITDKIKPNNDFATELFGKLKGFPLGIMIRKDGNTVTLMAKQVSDKTPSDAAFSLSVPQGYQLTPIEELEDTFKGKI